MLNITSEEISKFEKIGSGTFGIIYRKGEYAYKIYNETIVSDSGRIYVNPSCIYRKTKLNRLIELDKIIKNTDLVKDIVFKDNKFSGVLLKYYDGCNINKLMDIDCKSKMDISMQLLRNSKELTDHNIFPLDYKLNNIMYENGNARIIDLDDILTKVYRINSPYHKKKSIYTLDETIKTFFNEYRVFPFNSKLREKITRPKNKLNGTYDKILNYLLEKSKLIKLYLIDFDNVNESNFESIRKYKDFRIIGLYDNTNIKESDYYLNILNKLDECGIKVYEIIEKKEIIKYISNFNIENINEIKKYIKCK